MRAKLEIISGAKPGAFFLRLPSVIGRSGDAKIKLPASTVSRNHCELYLYEGKLVVRDLGSSNGTVVNGHRVDVPTFLTPDDELTIGPVTMRAVLDETGTTSRASTSSKPAAVNDQASPTPSPETRSAVDPEVSYTEDEDGSFLGIDEAASPADPDETPPPIVVDDGLGSPQPHVDEDDSRLNEFFKNFDN